MATIFSRSSNGTEGAANKYSEIVQESASSAVQILVHTDHNIVYFWGSLPALSEGVKICTYTHLARPKVSAKMLNDSRRLVCN